MTDTIATIAQAVAAGDDKSFSDLVCALARDGFFVFAAADEEDSLILEFLTYLLEGPEEIEYIPLFASSAEAEAFCAEEPVPAGFVLHEVDGQSFAETIEAEEFLMLCPYGIVFQGEHLHVAVENHQRE